MSDGSRTGRTSVSAPEEWIENAKEYAHKRGLSFSRLVRMSVDHAMEADGVTPDPHDYFERREEIKERNRFAQNKAFFLDRVDDRLTDLFTSRAKPKEIIDVARGYVEEAREIEAEARDRDDVADYHEGEIVNEVKRLVRETLEGQNLTNWDQRYTNRLERFEGVEDGLERRKFALVLTTNAMRKDQDLEPLRSLSDAERRVRGDDLPDLADEELPLNVDRDDVAAAARRLIDNGYQPDDVPTDPQEFQREFGGATFGWNDVSDRTPALEDPDANTGNAGAPIAADGGDLDRDDPDPDPNPDADDAETDGDGDETDDLAALIEWAADKLSDAEVREIPGYTDRKNEKRKQEARENAERQIRQGLDCDNTNGYMETMQNYDLTPDDVIELAEDYRERIDRALKNGDTDPVPVVPDEFDSGNGGVGA